MKGIKVSTGPLIQPCPVCLQLRYIGVKHSQTCLKTPLKGATLWSIKMGGLLAQVNYSEKCTVGDLKGWSFNTGIV